LNLFWLWAILRIAYRFVFTNVAEDDRSDNDDDEFEEEQRLDALAREKALKAASPTVLVNGSPVNGKATGTEIRTNGTANRKESRRKA
jgi:acyl-CoA-dependent ceramide synthase